MPRVKPEELTYEIESFVGTLKESDKHDWCKAVAKISWNNNPATLDIRNLNLSAKRIGKGISLTDEESDRLVDILLEEDYGTMEALEKAVSRRKNRFTITSKAANNCFDEKYIIEINL